jgi:hypothetical protein
MAINKSQIQLVVVTSIDPLPQHNNVKINFDTVIQRQPHLPSGWWTVTDTHPILNQIQSDIAIVTCTMAVPGGRDFIYQPCGPLLVIPFDYLEVHERRINKRLKEINLIGIDNEVHIQGTAYINQLRHQIEVSKEHQLLGEIIRSVSIRQSKLIDQMFNFDKSSSDSDVD